jgi:hypothetical protein
MSYRVRRIDPYWMKNPLLALLAAAGAGVAVAGMMMGKGPVAIAGAVVGGVAVFLCTKPSLSAVTGTLGLLGGIVTFILPNPQSAGIAPLWRVVSALFFSLFYMALMDGVLLLTAALYNLFAGVAGMGGLALDLEEDEDAPAA